MTLWFVCRVRSFFQSKWACRWKLLQICVQYEPKFLSMVSQNFLWLLGLCVECAAFFNQNELSGENSPKLVYSKNLTFSSKVSQKILWPYLFVCRLRSFSPQNEILDENHYKVVYSMSPAFYLRWPKSFYD